MKKIKILMTIIIMLSVVGIFNSTVYAADSDGKKLLYQDVTINEDGSINVKEAIWVNGKYNGQERRIKFSDFFAYHLQEYIAIFLEIRTFITEQK